MLGIVYLRPTSAAPCAPYRRRASALEAIRCIARNSDSGSAPQIDPAGASAGGVSSERFAPTSVAMQGRPDAIASRSELDMPSEREGSTNTSKAARKFIESDERPRNRMRVSAAARCRSASAHGLSIRPAISSSTRCLASNRMNASTSRSVPLIGLTVPSVPNLTVSSRSRPRARLRAGFNATPFGMISSSPGAGDSVDWTNVAVSEDTHTTLSDQRLTSRLTA